MGMCRRLVMGIASVLLLCASSLGADFSWTYQNTGFEASGNSPTQTALSMRGGLAWPVVYTLGSSRQGPGIQAFSLFAFENPLVGTNWHQLGAGQPVLDPYGSVLRAESSPTGGFGVAVQGSNQHRPLEDVAYAGNSFTGLGNAMPGVSALAYRSDGTLIRADETLISVPSPNTRPPRRILDVATSNLGDIAAVTYTDGEVEYWQESPLLGAWAPTAVAREHELFPPSIDLVFDEIARPHILGVTSRHGQNSVVAHRFDIVSGDWQASILETSFSGSAIVDVTAATDRDGTIGAAWVNDGVLKYAYLDTSQITPQWAVTTVTNSTPGGRELDREQTVGLEFDRNGLPVISFVSNYGEIWIAYDPPITAVPEPATLTLLSCVVLCGVVRRRRTKG